jgi:nitroimidazol reductase NimA-like FMN-containing flavoprotein (pyridoxamine 5'-phosphate oxidase superfamily)
VAVSVGAIPAVFPVNYYTLNGAIYFFTAEGTKLAAATRETVVAFEIDHCDAVYHQGWSVLAVGVAREVQEPVMHELVGRLHLNPWAPGSRGHLVRVWPDIVSGRRITSGAVPSAD